MPDAKNSLHQCELREKLQVNAQKKLQRVIELTQLQITALANNDQQTLQLLDKRLELVFGEKERAFGALREHSREHHC